MVIVARAPTRICLLGGGTDVNPYAAERGGAIVHAAIDKRHRVTLVPRADRRILMCALGVVDELELGQAIELGQDARLDLMRAVIDHFHRELPSGFALVVESDIQDGSGLGTSGSAGVAVIAAFSRWLGKPLERQAVARLAFELETERLGWAGGKQDQWIAASGGVNLTLFGPGEEVRVEPLRLSPARLGTLRRWLLLLYLGGRRASAGLQRGLQAGMSAPGDACDALDELRGLALRGRELLEAGDFDAAGQAMHLGWLAKKRSNPAVTSSRIDAVYERCRAAGALGGKLVGAGGAGFFYFLCAPQRQSEVVRAARELAASPVDFQFDLDGLVVEELR